SVNFMPKLPQPKWAYTSINHPTASLSYGHGSPTIILEVSSGTPTYSQSAYSQSTPTTSHDVYMGSKGLPTYSEYKAVEDAYLASVSQVKRKKALITQEMFRNIWDVLNHPDTRSMDPQFRFWVRKMFTLGESSSSSSPGAVVLHQDRPVAVKERIYELLCYV